MGDWNTIVFFWGPVAVPVAFAVKLRDFIYHCHFVQEPGFVLFCLWKKAWSLDPTDSDPGLADETNPGCLIVV